MKNLTPLEVQLLSALEKANWLLQDATGDHFEAWRKTNITPAIDAAWRKHQEKEGQAENSSG